MNYREYNDNELLSLIQEENEEAREVLFQKYEPLIQHLAQKYVNAGEKNGLEKNDFIQEGLLALHTALKEYDQNKEALFYTFVKTCIEHKMISLLIASKRQKHKILNESISFDMTADNGDTVSLEFLLEDQNANPENQILSKEYEIALIEETQKKLTDFELEVFELRRNEFEYKEIADILDKDPKSIDNAIQRIKTKMKHAKDVYDRLY